MCYVSVYARVCMCLRRLDLNARCLPQLLLTLFFRQSLTELVAHSDNVDGCSPQKPSVLIFSVLLRQASTATPNFDADVGNLNSEPQVCVGSTLL